MLRTAGRPSRAGKRYGSGTLGGMQAIWKGGRSVPPGGVRALREHEHAALRRAFFPIPAHRLPSESVRRDSPSACGESARPRPRVPAVFPLLQGCRKHQVPRAANHVGFTTPANPVSIGSPTLPTLTENRRAGPVMAPVGNSESMCVSHRGHHWPRSPIASGLKTVAASRKPSRPLVAICATAGISRKQWRDSGLEIVIQESSAVAHPARWW